jgi:hypothetical protein
MSRFDLSASQSARAGFMPTGGSPDVRWIRPDTPTHLPPPMPRSAARARTERAHALIVILLTLACTALSLLDLYLLASGS